MDLPPPFDDRPEVDVVPDHLLDTPLKDTGVPDIADILLHHLQEGPLQLAASILSINGSIRWKGGDPFKSINKYKIGRLVNILLGISKPMLELMIRGRLHEIFLPNASPDLRPLHNYDIFGWGGKGMAHIYALVLATHDGIAPTPNELERCIGYMDDYIKEDRTISVAKWADLDQLAREIDENQPPERVWSGGLARWAKDKWQVKMGAKLNHPRRYCTSTNTREGIKLFILKAREALAKIPLAYWNMPAAWSLVYVGWTSREARKWEHQNHEGTGTALKFLVEAVMANKVMGRQKRYFMEEIKLVTVHHYQDVGVAEHLCHLLCGSYNRWGRLNATTAGGMQLKNAVKDGVSDECWNLTAQQAEDQGVYNPAVAAFLEDLDNRRFVEKWLDEGSELEECTRLIKALELTDSRLEDLYPSILEEVDGFVQAKIGHLSVISENLDLLRDLEALELDLDFE